MPAVDWLDEALAGLPPMVTAAEACSLLRCTRRNLSRLVSTGRLHALRARESGSSRLLIPRASLRSYLERLDVR